MKTAREHPTQVRSFLHRGPDPPTKYDEAEYYKVYLVLFGKETIFFFDVKHQHQAYRKSNQTYHAGHSGEEILRVKCKNSKKNHPRGPG